MRAIVTALVIACVLSVLGVLTVRLSEPLADAPTAPPGTPISGRTQGAVSLSEGSTLVLSADARITVDLTPTYRIVHMDRGEVHFTVTKDALRPFLVEAPHATVRVTGTDFTVRSLTEGTNIAVHDGRVEVLHRGEVWLSQATNHVREDHIPNRRLTVLLAGGNLFVNPDGKVHHRMVVNAPLGLDSGVWGPTIQFQGERMSNVVAEINRHQAYPIAIQDEEIGELLITGNVQDPGDLDSVMAWLKAFDARIEKDARGRILLYSRPRH